MNVKLKWVVAGAAALFSVAAYGQAIQGTITGVVTDKSGAVVVGAKITVKNTDTGFLYPASSTATGNYTVPALPTGTYDLKVEAGGFKQFDRKGLTVEPASVMRIDVPMEVGAASETVTVTTEAPMLKTENSATVANVTVDQLESLPILSVNGGGTSAATAGLRDPYALLMLTPGTRYVASTSMSANGNSGMNILIEGMTGNMVNPSGTVTDQTQPSAEAVQEVAVLTSNYSPEYGNISGAVMNVTMRSGTNQYHGTAYAYGVNEALNAAQPFSGLKNKTRRYDFGGSFGGPVKIPKFYNGTNKTFFFFAYEEYLENGTINNTSATVPLPAYRNGNFSQLIPLSGNQNVRIGTANFVDPLGDTVQSGQLFDPNSTTTVTCNKTLVPTATCTSGSLVQVRSPFQGNQIPLTLFDPVALKVLALVPLPFGPNANAGAPSSNYQHGWNDRLNTFLPSIKVDHSIGVKGHVSAYYQTGRYSSPLVYPNGGADGLPEPINSGAGRVSVSHTARLAYDYTLTPTLLLHFAAGYSDEGNYLVPPVTNYNAVTSLGLTGATVNKLFPNFTTGVSTVTGGMSELGAQAPPGEGAYLTTQSSQQQPTAQANATWVKSDHTFKFGSDWRLEFEPVSSLTGTGGDYTFNGNATEQIALQGLSVSSGTTGFPFADFLLGDLSEVNIAAPANYRDQKYQISAYAQDTWKITRSLTLDYGLRYDFGTYLRERDGREAAFSVNQADPAAGGHPGGAIYQATCNCDFAKDYPWGFAPRIGLAYRLGEKSVVRAGFGIVYAPTTYAQGTVVSDFDSGTPGFGSYIGQLQNGIPSSIKPIWPNFSASAGALAGTVGAGPAVLGPGAGRPPRQYQWSVGVQRALTRNTVVEASYVGNRVIWLNAPGLSTLNVISQQLLNQEGFTIGNLADATLERTTFGNLTAAQVATLASRGLGLPYSGFPTNQLVRQGLLSFPQFTSLTPAAAPLGDSWYDALQVVVTQRLYHGLTLNANYLYSKSLALTSSPDPFNRDLGKNLSALDLPNQFRLSATYTVPTQQSGIFANKFLSYIVSGWQTGWYLQYQSAPILAPPASPTTNPISYWLGYGPGPAQMVPGQSLFASTWTDNSGVVHNTPLNINCGCFNPQTTTVLNPNAWTAVPDAQFAADQSSIRYYRGFRYPMENANFGRNFRLREKAILQLRVDWTNMFNRLELPQPTTTGYTAAATKVNGIYTGGFGTVVPTAGNGITGMRSGQVIVRITF
jgi:hypothetical protein